MINFRIFWVFDKNLNHVIELDDIMSAFKKFIDYIAEHKVKSNGFNSFFFLLRPRKLRISQWTKDPDLPLQLSEAWARPSGALK